ncbi:hypothetical protein VTJ49DRAFT_7650 [Mycothermus thermophilus]|uniref:Uncharacterized protein n=1 Tax=Humicola insolens TaxID=85995 RepID=A0ABR3VGB9_HUMIN
MSSLSRCCILQDICPLGSADPTHHASMRLWPSVPAAGPWPGKLLTPLEIFLLYLLARGVYSAFFHPLSRVPGPKLYAFSDLPYLYYLLRGEWPERHRQLHDKYGPVVRYTPSAVSFTTAGAWRTIYGHRIGASATVAAFPKDPKGYRPSESGHPHIVITNDDDHRRQRRVLAHAFSEKALRGQEAIMRQYVDKLISRLRERAVPGEPGGSVVDVVKWYNFTTFDLVGDLTFGEPFGCLDSGGYHPWVAMLFDDIRLITVDETLRRKPALGALVWKLVPKKWLASRMEHWERSRQTAMRRVESGNVTREDFMSYILRNNYDGESGGEKGGPTMTPGEIVENANILILAGSETTATLLSGVTFLLLTHPDKYNRLVKEIRGAFATDADITLTGLGGLDYLNAVLEEGMRMYPPVPILMPRIVPGKGENVEGYWIPGGTTVGVPHWASCQSKFNFHDANKFVPERWIAGERDAVYENDARDACQPFSYGPRNCLGRNLANAEMRLILAKLLWHFDLELQPESRGWRDKQKIFVLWDKDELNVKLTPVVRG